MKFPRINPVRKAILARIEDLKKDLAVLDQIEALNGKYLAGAGPFVPIVLAPDAPAPGPESRHRSRLNVTEAIRTAIVNIPPDTEFRKQDIIQAVREAHPGEIVSKNSFNPILHMLLANGKIRRVSAGDPQHPARYATLPRT